MKVPEYQATVRQQGLPSVRQSIPTSAESFASSDAMAMSAFAQRAAHDVQNVAMTLHLKELDEANRLRTQDAANQLAMFDQDQAFSQNGWRNQAGGAVFSQQNSKPLTDNVLEARRQKISEIADKLGNDEQKRLFAEHADKTGITLRGHLLEHEAEQYRVYKRGVLSAGIETESKNMALYYNDPTLIQQSIESIGKYGAELGKLEGAGEEYGRVHAQVQASNALKAAIDASLQHGDHTTASAILEKFGDHFDPSDRANVQNKIGDNWAASMLQSDPAQLMALTGVDPIERAILKAEGGADTFDANGQPAVSSDGKSIGKYQVTDATASAPGFGIAPAKERSHAEYNRIGKEMIAKLREKYNNDPAKVAAAYNAGSGAVDRAIAKGGDNWQDFIPASTRNEYLPRVAGFMKTGTPVDMMTETDRLQKSRAALAQLEKGRSVFASNLQNTIKDQYAAASDGKPVDIQPFSAFEQAYGDKAQQAYAEYRDQVAFYKDYHSIKDLPVADAAAMLEAMKPREGTQEYARELEQYQKLTSAYQHADQERKKDPIAWAYNAGYPVQPINWQNPQQAATELKNRLAISSQVAEKYATPRQILTAAEAKHLGETFDAMPASDALKLMDGLKKGADAESYQSAISQLRKDSPVTAMAGSLYGINASYTDKGLFGDKTIAANGQKAAEYILKGERLLNPTKGDKSEDGRNTRLFMPDEKDLRFQFDEIIGDAFAGHPEAASFAYQAARSAYAGIAAEHGATQPNPEYVKQAIDMVTGGVLDVFGSKVVPPYGMPEDVFIEKVTDQFTRQIKAAGMSTTWNAIGRFKIYPVGENRYGFTNGTTPLPVVVDLNS